MWGPTWSLLCCSFLLTVLLIAPQLSLYNSWLLFCNLGCHFEGWVSILWVGLSFHDTWLLCEAPNGSRTPSSPSRQVPDYYTMDRAVVPWPKLLHCGPSSLVGLFELPSIFPGLREFSRVSRWDPSPNSTPELLCKINIELLELVWINEVPSGLYRGLG